MPRFIKDEFDAFLNCGILARGLLRLRCGECGHDKLLAFSCEPRGLFPSCGARRMSHTAAHLVDHVTPDVPVLQVVQRVVTRHLLAADGLVADEGPGGAVRLIQRFGSAANLNTRCAPTSTGSACMPRCGWKRTTVSG